MSYLVGGEGVAEWGGDGDFAGGLVAGDYVAAFFEAVVSLAGGFAVGLVGGPASGRGSEMIDLALGDW